eukprot:TRINITY_DN9_c0_g3_i3.p1 TRINITY_DN9_c0_g3~~TRINITY_DN9_c0_g3_i3.p1  ORF type:complete len:112 (+),score=12.62 TRINITY_DN9_c0_g3_i3:89-424(+)
MGPQDNVSRRSLLYDKTYSDSLQSSLFVHFKLIKETTLNTSVFNHKVCLDFSPYPKNSRVRRRGSRNLTNIRPFRLRQETSTDILLQPLLARPIPGLDRVPCRIPKVDPLF